MWDADDLVRREIDLALQRNKHVIPVLVNGAKMPDRQELPACISELPKFDAVQLRHERLQSDLADLTKYIRKALAAAPSTKIQAPPPFYASTPSISVGRGDLIGQITIGSGAVSNALSRSINLGDSVNVGIGGNALSRPFSGSAFNPFDTPPATSPFGAVAPSNLFDIAPPPNPFDAPRTKKR